MDGAAYVPPGWLQNPHVQIVCGPLLRSRSLVAYRREILATPDGDEILLDHVDAGPGSRPRLLVLHGLEGSSYSVYVQGLLSLAKARGWNGTAMNFRSCARDPARLSRRIENHTARLYHSGETEDLDLAVETIRRREPGGLLFAVGGSLGGNVLLKWLGERPGQRSVRAAAAISTPYDLLACARNLESRLGRIYVSAFLRTLRPKALSVAWRFPEEGRRLDCARIAAARTFFEFDDAATAPLHGFAGAADYYSRSSSLSFLPRIRTETLCVSTQDDPFLPARIADAARAASSPPVQFQVTRSGSHLGFLEGSSLWSLRSWAESTVLRWLEERIG
ncbi:MAG: YheT family hydrolase [Thermoanaerobaculia bacterium]